jgi:hypothetical protein
MRAIVIALVSCAIVASCVREKPAPPSPVRPAAASREGLGARDLTGKPRDARQGITPGALEAEGPPPSPKKLPEKSRKNS